MRHALVVPSPSQSLVEVFECVFDAAQVAQTLARVPELVSRLALDLAVGRAGPRAER
jgi:hypothetical protein